MKVTSVFGKNIKAYNDGYRVIINKGSSRSSKSWSIVQLLHLIALKSKKPLIISIVSQTNPHLKMGVIRDFVTHLKTEGCYNDNMHNKSEQFFTIGKCTIEYFSADNTDKVHGPARDILFLNEPNKGVSFDIYHQLLIRTRKCVFIDYNPSGEFWLHTKGVYSDEDSKVIHSTWRENIENLTPAQLNDFRKAQEKAKDSDYWRYWWKVYGEGEDAVLLEERIMPFLTKIDKVPDDAVEIPAGLDFGFSDPLSLSRHWIRKNKSGKHDLFIKEVVYQSKLSINSKSDDAPNLTEILDAKEYNKQHMIIADCADPGAIRDMRSAGYNIFAVKKTAVEVSLRLFHDYNIYIVGDSPNVWREFENYKYDKNKEGVILSVPKKGQEDHCFIGETLINTNNGLKRIDSININDKVLTSNGYKEIIKIFNNGIKNTNEYRITSGIFTIFVTCTEDHLIKTNNTWKQIKLLKQGSTINLHSALIESAILNIKGRCIIQMAVKGYIGRCGNITREKYLKDFIFTTKTVTQIIIILTTLRLLKAANIWLSTLKNVLIMIRNGLRSSMKQVSRPLLRGTDQKKVGSGIVNTRKGIKPLRLKKKEYVLHAEKDSLHMLGKQYSAPITVNLNIDETQESIILLKNALDAARNLLKTSTQEKDIVQEVVLEKIISKNAGQKRVYDIMVDGKHEYFANGLLAHNCIDNTRYVLLMRNRWGVDLD